MRPLSFITLLLSLIISPVAEGRVDFDRFFADSTLRVDYIMGAGPSSSPVILLDGMSKSPVWAGRRHNLERVPLAGNGTMTLTDAATGDTIYRHSFSTLFQEWLSTDEVGQTPRAFETVLLAPLPKAETVVSVELRDARHQPMARMSHTYSPADVLVAVRGRKKPQTVTLNAASVGCDRAIDVAILGEGYTAAERDSFVAAARRAATEILSYEPFARYRDRFNIVAVISDSDNSGVSVPRRGEWLDTSFGSHFSTFYSDRYLTTPRVKSVHDALDGVPYEHIIILANTDEYGGGGIYNSYTLTAARHEMMPPVVVHEFGHSFGGLGDEYFYEGDVMEDTYPTDIEPWEPNITTLVDFDSKWRRLLPDGTPVPTPAERAAEFPTGVFEGGGYSAKGVYRPADRCRMRDNLWPVFCPACQDWLERLINFYISD